MLAISKEVIEGENFSRGHSKYIDTGIYFNRAISELLNLQLWMSLLGQDLASLTI